MWLLVILHVSAVSRTAPALPSDAAAKHATVVVEVDDAALACATVVAVWWAPNQATHAECAACNTVPCSHQSTVATHLPA